MVRVCEWVGLVGVWDLVCVVKVCKWVGLVGVWVLVYVVRVGVSGCGQGV